MILFHKPYHITTEKARRKFWFLPYFQQDKPHATFYEAIYIFPPIFFYFFGNQEGLVWTLLYVFSLCVIMLIPEAFNAHIYENITISRFFLTMLIIIIIGYGQEKSRCLYSRLLDEKNRILHREKIQLEKALAEIKTISGLIPICANCKKIRDDTGYWQQVETYMQTHSNADFTHSICPDCIQKLYPKYKA